MTQRKPVSKPNTIYGVINIDNLEESIANYNKRNNTNYYLKSFSYIDVDGDQDTRLIHKVLTPLNRPAYAVQDDVNMRVFDEVTDIELYILHDFVPAIKQHDDITDTSKFTDFDYAARVLDVYNKEHDTTYKLVRKLNYDPQSETYMYPNGVTEQLTNDTDTSMHVYCKDLSNDYLQFYKIGDKNELLFISKYFPETWHVENDLAILSHIVAQSRSSDSADVSAESNEHDCADGWVRFDGPDCARVQCAKDARDRFDRIFDAMEKRTQKAIEDARNEGKIYIEQPDIGYWKIWDTDGYYAGITTDDWKIIRDFIAEMDRGWSPAFLQEMEQFIKKVMCAGCKQTCARCRVNDMLRTVYRCMPNEDDYYDC